MSHHKQTILELTIDNSMLASDAEEYVYILLNQVRAFHKSILPDKKERVVVYLDSGLMFTVKESIDDIWKQIEEEVE